MCALGFSAAHEKSSAQKILVAVVVGGFRRGFRDRDHRRTQYPLADQIARLDYLGDRARRRRAIRHFVHRLMEVRIELPSGRSEEHTSELQSHFHVVSLLLLEKINQKALQKHCLQNLSSL